MSYVKGKPLCPEEKKLLVSVKQYFDRNRLEFGSSEPAAEMTADALGVGLATVNRVMASYRKDPDSINAPAQMRGRPSYSVDTSHQEAIRAYIRKANLEGHHITLESIRSFLQEKSPGESCHVSTLARALDRWGFEFGQGTRTQHLKEKDYIVVARQHYLRKMRRNRISGKGLIRPEVYLDESYINKNHSNDFVWYSSEDGPWIQKPTGKGERLIIMNAITQDGWIPEAVHAVTSVTLGRSRTFDTPVGLFSFTRVPQRKLLSGVRRVSSEGGGVFFLAIPLKALADYVYVHRCDWDSAAPVEESLRVEDESLAELTGELFDEVQSAYQPGRVSRFLAGLRKDLNL